MDNRTIIDFLNTQSGGHISFHMPGHKGRGDLYERAGYGSFLRGMIGYDITEIPGADALFCPETTIKAVMDNYAELYGVRHTELLVNGSSAGIMAALMATVPIGGRLILGRNSHHSAFSAMRLGGINPVYIDPDIDQNTGLVSGISPESLEAACIQYPEADAVLITSPNYYGVISDIRRLAEIAHRHDMVLIVDQAHGAHLKFFDMEAAALKAAGGYIPHTLHAAESLGADIVVNSTHKTLLSFTGSGILNICSSRVDTDAVSSMLRMLQTTSPSYILMASLDINEHIMRRHWQDIVRNWREDLTYFYKRAELIPGLSVITGSKGQASIYQMYDYAAGLDPSKINISMAGSGVSGDKLSSELEKRGIVSEMVHGDHVMLMTGAGNIREDYVRLLEALSDISDEYRAFGRSASGISGATYACSIYNVDKKSQQRYPDGSTADRYIPKVSDVPIDGEMIPLYRADGRVLYDPVIVYPPGTPVACPGEILDLELISRIADAAESGGKVLGITEDGLIKVGIVNY